jgi:hypothetical protein
MENDKNEINEFLRKEAFDALWKKHEKLIITIIAEQNKLLEQHKLEYLKTLAENFFLHGAVYDRKDREEL